MDLRRALLERPRINVSRTLPWRDHRQPAERIQGKEPGERRWVRRLGLRRYSASGTGICRRRSRLQTTYSLQGEPESFPQSTNPRRTCPLFHSFSVDVNLTRNPFLAFRPIGL
mgnify:CR=1 FL=1